MRSFRLIKIILIGLTICSCSSISNLDKSLVEENQLIEIHQDLLDKFFSRGIPECKNVNIRSVTASLHSSYNIWEESRWSKADKANLMAKWQDTFSDTFKQHLTMQGFELSNDTDCMNTDVDIYDIEFGSDGKTVSNYKRENTDFDLPLYSAKIRIKIYDPKSSQTYALILDNKKTNIKNFAPYRFEIDPEKTTEFINDWAYNAVTLMCDTSCRQ